MSRLLSALLLVLLVVVALALTAWYLAYGAGPSFTGSARVPGLSGPVTVAVDSAGALVVEAETEADLVAGLGYAHATQGAWPMALWRQTATGDLSRWFADSTSLVLDYHARRLGLGARARAAYADLPEEQQALLQAYARGVNRAFEVGRLAEGNEFVLLDVRPEPWQPWDALAVEQLVAYLATPAPTLPDTLAERALREDLDLRRFLAADSLFRGVLHLGGMQHALALAVTDSADGLTLVQRQVYGASALPLLREVVLRRGGHSTLVGSIPGTLAFPAGYGPDLAWSVFPTSGAATLAPADALGPAPSYDRVTDRNGNETLVVAYRTPTSLLVGEPEEPAPADTVAQPLVPADTLGPAPLPSNWQVRWRGFGAGTDLGAWLALLRGETPQFRLFTGDGLLVRDGTAEVLGSPAVVQAIPGGRFVGGHAWSAYAARRAVALTDSADATPGDFATDTYSTWAEDLAPPLIEALGRPEEAAEDLRDAIAFLRGWRYRYEEGSIAASLFETWLDAFERATGDLPNPDSLLRPIPNLPPDSAAVDSSGILLLRQALRQATAELTEKLGRSPSQWRWERVQEAARTFPLWSEAAREEVRGPGGYRYAPIRLPDGGHPTALEWGASPLFAGSTAPGTWVAWGAPGEAPVHVRHRVLYARGFLAREFASIEPLTPLPVSRTATPERRVRLQPAER